jgi:hypothetical protein
MRARIFSHAARAALPLRSAPLEAAVAEALLLHRQPEGAGHHLPDLGVDALPHLGGARRDLHGAVEIDVDEGAALVEELGVEGDAELDRRHREAPQVGLRGRVEGAHGLQARGVVGAFGQRVEQAREGVVAHGLPVGRHVAVVHAIDVAAAHVEGVQL